MPHTSIVGDNVIQWTSSQHVNLQGTRFMGQRPDSDSGITWTRRHSERPVSMTSQTYKWWHSTLCHCKLYIDVNLAVILVKITKLKKKFKLLNPYHRHLLHDLTQFPNRIHLCNGTNTLLNGNKISFTPKNLSTTFLVVLTWHTFWKYLLLNNLRI